MADEITQLTILQSIADIYYSMHLINLKENTVFEYSARNQVKDIVIQGSEATNLMVQIISTTVKDEQLDEALSFTDLVTLSERMKGKKYITKEIEGKNIGWIEATFITVQMDEEQRPTSVIFTTRSIQEEKQKVERLIFESNTDELTGFFNRRGYEDNLKAYNDYASEEDFVYLSIDVNGLKVVNDTLGHAAGDELLRGAAECMKQCLGPYGRLFRTGGDEFAAIVFATDEALQKILSDFRENLANWSGKYIDGISVAIGAVARRHTKERSVRKIAALADAKMYEDKERYYATKGVDRRGQKEAHTALCELYTKILKINLAEDSYQIVDMDTDEQLQERGFSETLSEWIRSFGTSGQVHPEDLEEYLAAMEFSVIREHFQKGMKSYHIFYRRKMNGEYKKVMLEIIPAKDHNSETQTYYLYVKDI